MSTPEYRIEPVAHHHLTDEPTEGLADEKKVMLGSEGMVTVQEVSLAEKVMEAEETFSQAEYSKLKRKVDWVLLPLMWWCYGIQQTDKTGLGTMNLYGLQKSTGMQGNQYSLLTVVFYVAYALFEFPSNFVLQRYNMGKTLTIYMFIWGIVVLVQAFLNDWASFMALRFLQGAFECTISPGFNLIIASWYTTREHNARSLVFQSANAGWGIVVDLSLLGIAKAANKEVGGFDAWRGIAIFLGGQTLIASAIAWFLLGTPNEVRWLSAKEKIMANARVMSNHAGTDLTGRKTWKWDQVKEAFLDPVTWFQFINAFLSSVANGAITTFGSVSEAHMTQAERQVINKSFGFTNDEVIIYGIPRSIVSVLWFAVVGYTTLRVKGVRMYFMLFSSLPPFAGLLGLALLPADVKYKWDKWGLYLCTVTFVLPLFTSCEHSEAGPPSLGEGFDMSDIGSLISSNCAGRTKRSVLSSLSFIAYCTGNIAGSQVMKAKDAPHYIPGTIAIAACMGVEFLNNLCWRFWLVYQNKKKLAHMVTMNMTTEAMEIKAQELGAEDVTDKQNPYFIYSL
ncbi:MFS transporter, ACS family, allantoate permease, partial [Tremellales sp. Uapishka_1]